MSSGAVSSIFMRLEMDVNRDINLFRNEIKCLSHISDRKASTHGRSMILFETLGDRVLLDLALNTILHDSLLDLFVTYIFSMFTIMVLGLNEMVLYAKS
jgi:hypothetical protein